jgi:hypothetical protein
MRPDDGARADDERASDDRLHTHWPLHVRERRRHVAHRRPVAEDGARTDRHPGMTDHDRALAQPRARTDDDRSRDRLDPRPGADDRARRQHHARAWSGAHARARRQAGGARDAHAPA